MKLTRRSGEEEEVVSDSATARFLHVANGSCTTDIIEAARLPGARSIWADPLYEGPVPAGLSDDELLNVRARYLAGPDEDATAHPMNDLRVWRHVIADHESYDELVLWFEHDLFDQLNLIQLLTWIRGRPASRAASLVCIGAFSGRRRFKGLGELSPEELAPLFDTRHPLSDAEYDLAEQAWEAFRRPGPEALDALRDADTTALPYLGAAIERFLQEYPSTMDGLSRSERRLLRLADPGPIAVKTAFPRMHDEENAYYITDGGLADLVTTLSRTSPPLITRADNGSVDVGLLSGTISLTGAGREVLTGRRDRVACGIDRWLGGAHLQSGAPIWRWDDEQRRIRSS